MATPDRDFVRAHHVHYEVEPEEVVAPGHHEVTGWRVRLFATHGEERLEDPACPRCVELRRDLRELARAVAPPDAEGHTAEIVTAAAPKLFKSAEVPGADEVHVTLRVLCATPSHHAARGAPAEGCLAPVAARLAELGVPRR